MPLLQPILQVSDHTGKPLSFARAYFYLADTTDPVAVFADGDLEVELPWPVVADDAGIFPSIYYDGREPLRLKLTTEDGDLANPVADISPVNSLFKVYADDLADGAIEAKLGYVPVDPANAVFTAPARLSFDPTELNPDDVGFRGTPIVIRNASAEFAKGDSGKIVVKDDGGEYNWTIPLNAYPLGHYIELLVNNAAGNVNLLRAGGVDLITLSDGTNENRVLPPRYKGRITQVASNKWVLEPPVELNPNDPSDLSANGFYKLTNGYTRQWGRYVGNMNGDSTRAVIFPSEFPNECFGVAVTAIVNGLNNNADMSAVAKALPTKTGFDVYVTGPGTEQINGFFWEAWGR